MSSGRKLPSAMTLTLATTAGINQYSSLDEKITKMRKMKHKAKDDDDGGDEDDAMDVDKDASSSDELHLQQGLN